VQAPGERGRPPVARPPAWAGRCEHRARAVEHDQQLGVGAREALVLPADGRLSDREAEQREGAREREGPREPGSKR
jgi:hypothetical protein